MRYIPQCGADAKTKARIGVSTGERNAVRIRNSGLPVDHSGPELRVGPTLPATTGRTPGARPPVHAEVAPAIFADAGFKEHREAGLSQRKSGPMRGHEMPASSEREALALSLDQTSIAQIIDFFSLLDRWDREAHGPKTM
jgi:hypothetical protein